MAAGPITQIADVVVPQVFTPYVQQQTELKSRLVQSGALARDTILDGLLAGGGLTFNIPSWRDLDNDDERVSTDSVPAPYTNGVADPDPKKIESDEELAVRLSRNNSWSTANLAATLAGSDPAGVIAGKVSDYWVRRLQAVFVATMKGIFADNDLAPSATEHVRYDLTNDVSGSAYSAGVTDFSAEAYLGAKLTMGDSMDDLSMIMVHSVVYNRMQNNNLIDFIPDSEGRVNIPTFLRAQVIVDDGVPAANGVYESWLFGPGAVRLGVGSPAIPTEVQRLPGAGNGGGADTLYSRVEWCIHPTGHKYAGTPPKGGPDNTANSNMLAAAGSWQRVYPERKQIKIARLITREA